MSAFSALEVLREEHRWIARMLELLERLVAEGKREGRLAAEPAAELLALFQHFADGLHQEREESCLFARLFARVRTVEERVALGRLCGEHEEERRALRTLAESLLGAIYGRAGDLASFVRASEAFVRLHRRHLAEETRELLPMAERLLEPEDDALLLELYHRLELDGPDLTAVAARITRLAERLEPHADGAATSH
jgi:hemerythrin-like domain-containing protein